MLRAMARWAGARFPLLRDIYRFARGIGFFQFRGVYRNFSEAAAAAHGKKLGFNRPEVALVHKAELIHRLDNTEYPLLFHLQRILGESGTIVDLGGSVGTHFLRYRNHLDLQRVNWIVCDVPEMTALGKALCADFPNVAFVNDIAEIKAARIDVFLTCGSLQYIDLPSPELPLRRLIDQGNRPAHILIDQLPLYDGHRFVTLQHSGGSCFPHHVFNRAEFLETYAGLGYELVDRWDNRFDSCVIPFHPERTVQSFTGLCFADRRSAV